MNNKSITQRAQKPGDSAHNLTKAQLDTYLKKYSMRGFAEPGAELVLRTAKTVVLRYGPETARKAQNALWYVTRFVAWLLNVAHVDISDVDSFYTPDNVSRYCESLDPVDTTAGTTAYWLNEIGRLSTVTAPWPPKPRQFGRSHLAPPYSRAEIRRLIETADLHPHSLHGRLFSLCIALGLGIGANSKPVIESIRKEDVVRSVDGLDITVHHPETRTIRCRRHMEGRVESALNASPSELLVGKPGQLNNNVYKFGAPTDALPLQLARLRSTWLLELLNDNVPLVIVLKAAGMETPANLAELVPLLDVPDSKIAGALLRGGRSDA